MTQSHIETRPTHDWRCISLVLMLCFSLPLFHGCSKRSSSVEKKPSASPGNQSGSGNSQHQPEHPQPGATQPPPIQNWGVVVDLKEKIAIFETVFWEPRDSISMRKLIRETELVKGKKVLEIGTGSGLISLCCLARGADSIVATDVNPAAIENATFNASLLNWKNRLEARLVSLENPAAYAVIKKGEKFDLIFSNPPWEDDVPKTINEFALYDPGFKLIDSMLKDLKQHLNPGGKAYLAYGCISAVKLIQALGSKYDLQVEILDERKLKDLDEVFLPGMMLEITPNWPSSNHDVAPDETKPPQAAIWLRSLSMFTIA